MLSLPWTLSSMSVAAPSQQNSASVILVLCSVITQIRRSSLASFTLQCNRLLLLSFLSITITITC